MTNLMEIKFFGLYISDQNIKETFLKKEFTVTLKKTLQKNPLPDNDCHLISKGRHNGSEIANQEEHGNRLPMQTIKKQLEYLYTCICVHSVEK